VAAQANTIEKLETDVATAFEVLGWEIELAGARCIYLDALIGELMPGMSGDQKTRLLEGLHADDLLGQHLTSLSAFARRVSAEAPAGVVGVSAALSEITLGALADRMSTAFGGEEGAGDDESDAGDLDLV
jgi:hypothetical protein